MTILSSSSMQKVIRSLGHLSTSRRILLYAVLLILIYHPTQLMNIEQHYSGCRSNNIKSSCLDFSTNSAPVDRELLLNPQCIELMHRLQCSIYHVTCRNNSSQSQLFDLPCQSSCLSLFDVCIRRVSTRVQTTRENGQITNRYQAKVPESNQFVSIQRRDCLLLPAGGCDKWIDYFTRTGPNIFIEYSRIMREVTLNALCPDVNQDCQKMFPDANRNKYRKRDFKRENFTVVAQVMVTQTLWAFHGSTQFHPYFRLKILYIHRSDIPLAVGNMPTMAWPLRCICPNQLHVNQTYFMLAHSSYMYQTISLSTKSVFLPTNRRYIRKIPCWTKSGRCWRRRRGTRKRRRRNRIRNDNLS